MTERSGNTDLYRFIAALLIMAHHLYNVIGTRTYPFHDCWIYVEFFLLITGYYTAKHYSGKKPDNVPKNAVTYTIKKFLPLLPYAVSVTLIAWITDAAFKTAEKGWGIKDILLYFTGKFSFDVLLISDSYTHPLVVPLWYISAMLIVFPLFAILMQVKNRYLKMILCLFVPLMYYGWQGVTGTRTFPLDMTRVFCGMMLGAFMYETTEVFGGYIRKIPAVLLTIAELFCLIIPILSCYKNLKTFRFDYLCFFICLAICLPGFSYTGRTHGKFFSYLGKLSMPVFIIHWYMGTLAAYFSKLLSWSKPTAIIIYYVSTIIVSALAMFIVDRWKWFGKLTKSPLNLPD